VVLTDAQHGDIPPEHDRSVGTILDDDPMPGLLLTGTVVTEGDGNPQNATFTVTLSEVSRRAVMVDYATMDGSATAPEDYLSESGTITFTPGTTSQFISITLLGDLWKKMMKHFS